jgi:hypothetical protein
MSHRTHILGYIEMTEATVLRNEAEIAAQEHLADAWPFRQCLILPARKCYASYSVSIFDCIKCDPEDWPLWINQFEQVLLKLEFVVASVAFLAECGDALLVSYGKLNDALSRTVYKLDRTLLLGSPGEWFP